MATSSYRDRAARRSLHDLGNTLTGRPRDLVVTDSQHDCTRCRKHFNAHMADLAVRGKLVSTLDFHLKNQH